MIDLIKSTSTKEKSSLKELLMLFLYKSDWEYLEKELDDSKRKANHFFRKFKLH